MPFEELSTGLVEFVSRNIDSVEQIFILQLLHDRPDVSFTIPEIAKELRSVDSSIRQRMDGLYRKRVLARSPSGGGSRHSFSPADDGKRADIEELLRMYDERPAKVVELIYAKASPSIQAFSDAFKIRKEEEE